jgi:hypothetical protein
MQLRSDYHERCRTFLKERFEGEKLSLDKDMKLFFKLFEESTFEGSQAAAQNMIKIAKRKNKNKQNFLLMHSVLFLVSWTDSEMLSWPNSPLLVMLQVVSPNVLPPGCDDAPLQQDESRESPIHYLAELVNCSDYSTHENQLVLAKQLIEKGNNVKSYSIPDLDTPLHKACNRRSVTNLDFVELLLKEGADPNSRNRLGLTPLASTIPEAPGAAKFLLNWPTTDVNITTPAGASFLASVRKTITAFSKAVAQPDNPYRLQQQFAIQQWREIEEMLVKKGARDTGITLTGCNTRIEIEEMLVKRGLPIPHNSNGR